MLGPGPCVESADALHIVIPAEELTRRKKGKRRNEDTSAVGPPPGASDDLGARRAPELPEATRELPLKQFQEAPLLLEPLAVASPVGRWEESPICFEDACSSQSTFTLVPPELWHLPHVFDSSQGTVFPSFSVHSFSPLSFSGFISDSPSGWAVSTLKVLVQISIS
jgi:hypothetical protein